MDGIETSQDFADGESPISSNGLNDTSDRDEVLGGETGNGDGDGPEGLFGSGEEDEGSEYV